MKKVSEFLRRQLIAEIEGDKPSQDLIGGDPKETQEASLNYARKALLNNGRNLDTILAWLRIAKKGKEQEGD